MDSGVKNHFSVPKSGSDTGVIHEQLAPLFPQPATVVRVNSGPKLGA